MQKFTLILLACSFISGCHNEPASLSGTEHIDVKDFMAAFKEITLPSRFVDSNFTKAADTTAISFAVFSQFVPDSVLKLITGKNPELTTIHPIGKFDTEDELYLFACFIQNKRKFLQAFVFNQKSSKYLSHLELLSQGAKNDNYTRNVSITSEPTFIISREKINKQNELAYTRNGYAYNSKAHGFIAVLTDTNEDEKRLNEIINPIDTFPAKNKYSGDYAENKKNFISVRDGSNASKYLFFIHFEKTDNCIGELKGEMTMRDLTHGYYRQSGDPCVIDFTFGTKNITVKEQGNCGNHRGIKCFFDDTYRKKKQDGKKKDNK